MTPPLPPIDLYVIPMHDRMISYDWFLKSPKNDFSDCCVFLCFSRLSLTHWGRVTHVCVVKQTIIGSDNGLSPGRRQAIIWTNAGILLIGPLGTNFSEILIGIETFLFKKMHLKMSSAKWRPFCLGLNVLKRLIDWPTLFHMVTCLDRIYIWLYLAMLFLWHNFRLVFT